VVHSITK